MPTKTSVNYRVNAPLAQSHSTMRAHLLVIILPLLVVSLYCGGYIEFRVHQQHDSNVAREHFEADSNNVSQLPITVLQPQTNLQTVTVPAGSNLSGTARGNGSSNNLSSGNVIQYLQNSSANHHNYSDSSFFKLRVK